MFWEILLFDISFMFLVFSPKSERDRDKTKSEQVQTTINTNDQHCNFGIDGIISGKCQAIKRLTQLTLH